MCLKRPSSPRRHSRDSSASSPVVRVPVLSRATTLTLARVSTAAPPRKRTPRRAPQAIAERIEDGTEKDEGARGGDDQECHRAVEGAHLPALLEEGRKIE